MESQQGVSLLEMLTLAFAVAVLILVSMQYVPFIVLLLIFVGVGHVSLFFAIGVMFGSSDDPKVEEVASNKHLEKRTDVKLLAAVTVLPMSTSVLMALTHRDIYLYALANAIYLLSLAFAVWAVARDEPICVGGACKAAGLAQVISALVVVATHQYIFNTHHYELQDALALFDAVPSFFAYLILISAFVVLSLKGTQKS
jgi:hypothetical protein